MWRALQLTAVAISVVDAIALVKTTESQAHELTEKRIMVKFYNLADNLVLTTGLKT